MKNIVRAFTLGFLLLCSSFALAGTVNINTADTQTLADSIKGIGLKKAQAIVDYREKHGPFKSVDELTQVKGIGDKLLEKNRANLVVKKAKSKPKPSVKKKTQ